MKVTINGKLDTGQGVIHKPHGIDYSLIVEVGGLMGGTENPYDCFFARFAYCDSSLDSS